MAIELYQIILAVFFFVSMGVSPANSAIVYSGRLDVKGPNFSIDLNSDGSNDFVTEWRTWAEGSGYSLTGFDVKMNLGIRFLNTKLTGDSDFPGTKAPLDYGELIGPTPPQGLLWAVNSNDAMMWTTVDDSKDPFITYSGVWHDLGKKYLGFELNVGSRLFYGWIQLDTDVFNNVTLVDWAYEDVSETPIKAGVILTPVISPILPLLLE